MSSAHLEAVIELFVKKVKRDRMRALARVVGRERDALVHPIGSRVAYYENHEGERYLLERA